MSKKNEPEMKPNAAEQTMNGPGANAPVGAPFNEQDPKRRLGNFGGAGEHPRKGGRTSGIVGQTTKQNHTDKSQQ